eukprot:2257639-Pyramimonas_sp.AAC.1
MARADEGHFVQRNETSKHLPGAREKQSGHVQERLARKSPRIIGRKTGAIDIGIERSKALGFSVDGAQVQRPRGSVEGDERMHPHGSSSHTASNNDTTSNINGADRDPREARISRRAIGGETHGKDAPGDL